ncbi:hypothetical protein JCM24511_10157 [Saitozyma sp. JCM 24511]|nr:hypothetical protein JCM24511_10157 [Saitozyma sp. JCM 24511]
MWVLIATPTPMFFLYLQLAISVVLLLGCHLRRLSILLSFNLTVARKLSPLILINVRSLTFNTICLHYVDASFYQIARGLVLPIAVGPAFATGVLCAALSSPKGVFFGILSSGTTAIHSIVIKSSLAAADNSAVNLAWYANLLSTVVIFPFILVAGEFGPILHMLATPEELETFLVGTAVTGVLCFLICVAGLLFIKVTLPVTQMISSAARGASRLSSAYSCSKTSHRGEYGATVCGCNPVRARTSSIVIITIGSCAYVRVKYEETLEAREQEHRYGLALDAEEVYGEQGAIDIDKPTGLIRKPEEVGARVYVW